MNDSSEPTANNEEDRWVVCDADRTSITFVSLVHKFDNVCSPDSEVSYRWGDFVAEMVHDGHELRGDAGQSPSHDDSYKSGLNGWAFADEHYEGDDRERRALRAADMRERLEIESYAACLPVRVAWDRPVGGDAPDDGDARFLRQHGDKTSNRRRTNAAIAGSDAVVVLDLDDVSPDEFEGLCDRLDTNELDAVLVSSYNHGRDLDERGKPTTYKLRLFVRATRGYLAEDIRPVRIGLANLLGVRADGACLHPASLFFWPATRPDRAAHAILERFDGGAAVDPSACLARGLEIDRPRSKSAEPGLVSVSEGEVSEVSRQLARGDLDSACNRIARAPVAARPHAPSLRSILFFGVRHLGQYIAAGALDHERTLTKLQQAYDSWREESYDDQTVEHRHGQIAQGLRDGIAKGPAVPVDDEPPIPDGDGDEPPIPDDDEPPIPDGDELHSIMKPTEHNLARIRTELAERAEDEVPEVSIDEARTEMARFFKAFTSEPDKRHLCEVTLGAGKTSSALTGVAASEGLFAYTARNHVLNSQTARDAQELGVSVDYLRGVGALEEKTGVPGCPRLEWETAKSTGKRHLAVVPSGLSKEDASRSVLRLQQHGVSFLSSVCPSCSLGDSCAAREHAHKPVDPDVRLVVCPPELLDRALEAGRLPIFDEEPPREQPAKLTAHTLALVLDHAHALPLEAEQAQVVVAIAEALRADPRAERVEWISQATKDGIEDVDPVGLAEAYRGLLRVSPGVPVDGLGARLDAARAILQFALGFQSDKRNGLETEIPSPAWMAWERQGGLMLTATRDPSRYRGERAVEPHRHLKIRVRDGAPIAREILPTDGSKVGMCFGEDKKPTAKTFELFAKQVARVRDRHLAAVGAEAFARHRFVVGVLLPLLKDPRTLPLLRVAFGDSVRVVHYEGVLGLNDLKDGDVFVSFHDPRPGDKRLTPHLSAKAAERLLAQFHGRARDPSRSTPAWHYHVGGLVPSEWSATNTRLVALRRGPAAQGDTEELLALVGRFVALVGSKAEAARLLACGDRNQVGRWLNRKNNVSAKYATAMRSALGEPEPVVISVPEVELVGPQFDASELSTPRKSGAR